MFWKRKKIDEPVQVPQQPKQFERKQLTDNALKRELKEIRTNSQSPIISFGFSAGNTAGNINSIINMTLPTLVAKSRELSLNNGIARKYFQVNSDGVTGASGLYIRPDVNLHDDNEENLAINEELEHLFYKYADNPEAFSMNGKMDLAAFQRLVERTRSIDGEAFIIVHDVNGTVKFELIDSMRVPVIGNRIFDDGTYVSNGIHFDQYGKAIEYYVTKVNPTSYTYEIGNYDIIPASRMLHLMIEDYPNQQRGIPDIVAGTTLLKDLEAFIKAAIISKKLSASAMAFITNSASNDEDVDFMKGYEPDYYENDSLQSGALVELQPGQNVTSVNPNGATDGITEFVNAQMQQIAMSLGITEQSLSGSTANASFSAAKLTDRLQRQTFKTRTNALTTFVLKPIYSRWLKAEMLRNKALDLNFSDFDKLVNAKYVSEFVESLDPLKDVQTQVLMIDNKIKSRSMVVSEFGYDPYQVLKEIELEEAQTINTTKEVIQDEETTNEGTKPTEDK
ncbi:phage portal protein [Enterobacter hormaechei]|uniref:phage portal protein n=1 Tax=Cronobacter sakazakii TaxID=28141 RepID=UPI001BD29B04|nr:phage portal protein [Cronobacter sakazakii]EHN8849948.1 phage portal protein [Enterobacter hormaechei]EHN8877282.1 phage portal protein [Enterobacter hormaechei]ELC6571290.1 phage portal protein [Enterobacter hormaechei]MCI0190607.1 phage portal protein [Cronobacter sakazakii]MCI0212363.1 phage portal protein [Cronobacter sakazakii]